jgi:hypothetical protein
VALRRPGDPGRQRDGRLLNWPGWVAVRTSVPIFVSIGAMLTYMSAILKNIYGTILVPKSWSFFVDERIM